MAKINVHETCKALANRIAESLRPNIILNPEGSGIHLVSGDNYHIYYTTGFGPEDLNIVITIPARMPNEEDV